MPAPDGHGFGRRIRCQQLERLGVLDGKGIPGRFHATGQVKVREQDLVGQFGGRFLQNTRWRSVSASKNADSNAPIRHSNTDSGSLLAQKKERTRAAQEARSATLVLVDPPVSGHEGRSHYALIRNWTPRNRHNRTRPYLMFYTDVNQSK